MKFFSIALISIALATTTTKKTKTATKTPSIKTTKTKTATVTKTPSITRSKTVTATKTTTKVINPIGTLTTTTETSTPTGNCPVYPDIPANSDCSSFSEGYSTCVGDTGSSSSSIAICDNNAFVLIACPSGTSCVINNGAAYCGYQCVNGGTGNSCGTVYPDLSQATNCTFGQQTCSGTQIATCVYTDVYLSTGYITMDCGPQQQCLLSNNLPICQLCPSS
ncbi:hypothetical protein HK103_000301 [Boothiomyces macroporosus]|uniref:Secreted protein n=1 Tax=Boothiomyces macroporosus TaxID=261099 RepID=A0AAD5Y7L4_9FUNG|nr:hypothetical protein HK103_000279 [Boothiomyces macroporosus]KAJ3260691.1 hypothetical protein HK103_000301 [Boothiomyces macroporosus]